MKKIAVAKVNDLSNGEMKAVQIDKDNKILICKIDNEYYALSHTCPHYGAPLDEGILHKETIVCPWHHSCFNGKTGDVTEPPSIQSLVKFDLEVTDNEIFVKVPDELESARIPDMTKPDSSSLDEVIIIGAGAAGYMAAQTLRENGFKGIIKMLTTEDSSPYDRPNLSKDYLAGKAEEEWMPLRAEEFYKTYGIDIVYNKTIKELHSKKNLLVFEDGMHLNFSKLLIASGGTPVKFNLPGSHLKNIFYLRSWKSSDEIIKASSGSENISIIGGSFIGMEAAYHLRQRTGNNVTVIIKDEFPFVKTFGPEIGKLFLDHHRSSGINFFLNRSVKSFEGEEFADTIVLDNGDKIKTDMVLAGIGVKPALDFIKDIELEKDGSLKVDEYFCVNGNIFAAGDITSFPSPASGKYTRIEHWRTALQQGKSAALNILGKSEAFRGVPFFWTRHGEMGIIYAGHSSGWDEIVYSNNPGSKEFIAYYIKDNRIEAAAGMNKNKEMAAIHELFYENRMPDPEVIRDPDFEVISLL